jgi:hypothetical protein
MVATSATAILNDIYLSNASAAPWAVGSDQNPQEPRISRKFLTARVNRTLSTQGFGIGSAPAREEMFKTK